jgi:endonuclease III
MLKYKDVATLLSNELTQDDSPETRRLIRDLRVVRLRGHLTKQEFLAICRWKSPRSIRHGMKNSSKRIRRHSAIALASCDERARLEALTALDGVGVPTASAILTLTNPRRYGVIDIRVWRLLFELGSVRTKPGGVGFTFNEWSEYLAVLRLQAKRLGASVRAVEYSLFLYHRRTQEGVLYERA